jgi:iron complex outermembrane receptor protein
VRYALEHDHEGGEGHEDHEVRIDVRQNRFDGRAEFDLGKGFVDNVRFRAGHADYRHDEIEDNGEIGTSFFNKGVEGRLEFVQSTRDGWGGGFGAQYFRRSLNIVGEEKFLPRTTTEQYGVFTLQTFDLGAVRAEAGARYEHSISRADADADIGNPRLRRSFNAVSASAGASYDLGGNVRIGLNASHSQRAPSAEELFAGGPHAGTQSFEIGDPDLKKEKSSGIEATLTGSGEGYSFGASVFHSWFDDYIYQQITGDIEDDLPVFENRQNDARYFGIEVEASVRLAQVGKFAINLDGVADYVRATIVDVGPAPRIPPFRILGGLEAQSDDVQARVEVERVAAQNRLAEFETRTDGYTMVNASLSFKPFSGNASTILLSANNIFDVDARRHASFLKDFAPLAGRDLRVTARISF